MSDARRIQAKPEHRSANDLADHNTALRLGISISEVRRRHAAFMAAETRAARANPVMAADDADHYESTRAATNRGEW